MPEFQMNGKDAPEFQALDDFTQGYIEAAFFTQSGEEDDGGTIGDKGFQDLAPETLAAIVEDCRQFQERNAETLAAAYAQDYTEEQAGHDFWLTRNGHGAGFWDRGLGDIGERLTAACGWRTDFPEVNLYLGDDGKIYYYKG